MGRKPLTYGEAHRAELESMELINGEFTKTVHILNKAERMKRDDAICYYNTKLFKHWVAELDEETAGREKLHEMHIKIEMFGHPENAKLLEE